ncbi:serine/threonine protein kinase [Blastomyces parvus]|uniref:non-specific serine/threonine protein kinase n=1 Tax=Blastomyces parvus TaxID=2060905 RepID=A0A2B7WR07_9EURO|nr:serine/threonine protein kinase [Blastomyces parvus]
MTSSKRNPYTIFSLVPLNQRAREVIADPENQHLTSTQANGIVVLDIGFHIRSRTQDTLATLGRGDDADIYVSGSMVSKIQCSFEIETESNVIMLYDRSYGQTTQVFGDDAVPFEHGRSRKVVVLDRVNTIIGMGGVARNLVQFKLRWHFDPLSMMNTVKDWKRALIPPVYKPRNARTIDESDTILGSRRVTRPHTATQGSLIMRYSILSIIGSGAFGQVHRAVDMDSGKLMAVKLLTPPGNRSEEALAGWRQSRYYSLKREVEAISHLSHPHIVEYIDSQGWGDEDGRVEIFMALKEGSLESLCLSGATFSKTALFNQMILALCYLADKDIIHRDIKPENILYVTAEYGHKFQLGDFGVCNATYQARTVIGTQLYMAPEVARGGEQTPKADVWSLFVTMVWTFDCQGFREKSRQFVNNADIYKAIDSIATSEDCVASIKEMAVQDPRGRASALDMLQKCRNSVAHGAPTPMDVDQIATPAFRRTPERTPEPGPVHQPRRPNLYDDDDDDDNNNNREEGRGLRRSARLATQRASLLSPDRPSMAKNKGPWWGERRWS